MGQVKHITAALACTILLGGLVGCSFDRWERVEPGKYVIASRDEVLRIQESQKANPRLQVDRRNHLVKFFQDDGSEILLSFKARAKSDWPAGCPTNIHMTHMEVLDLEAETLTFGSNIFRVPILVRNCPRNPERVVLRADGEMGGSGTACRGSQACIYFRRVETK